MYCIKKYQMSIIKNRVAVLLWLYHTDLWQEFKQLLLPLNKDIHLYLGLCQTQNLNINTIIEKESKNSFELCTVNYFSNAGVDVRPFLHQLCSLNPDSEPYFLKLHSKISKWGIDHGINWRAMLLHSLIGSKNIFTNNIRLLQSEQCGMVCNKTLILSNREYNHKSKIQEICNIIGIDYSKLENKNFCGGNIFAGNTKLYQQYLCNKLSILDNKLLSEKGKTFDWNPAGTYSHSLERIFGYLVEDDNKNIIGSEIEQKLILLNKDGPNGQFNLIINYDNSCYIEEDPNVYGLVLEYVNNKLLIRWLHKARPVEQAYVSSDLKQYEKIIF